MLLIKALCDKELEMTTVQKERLETFTRNEWEYFPKLFGSMKFHITGGGTKLVIFGLLSKKKNG